MPNFRICVILFPRQCNTNIKFLTEYEYEYIRKKEIHRIQIANIFISRQLTEYEYRIYSFLTTWQNTNIEYICCPQPGRIWIWILNIIGWIQISNIFVTRKLSIRIWISDIRQLIFEYIRVTLNKQKKWDKCLIRNNSSLPELGSALPQLVMWYCQQIRGTVWL